MKAIIRELPFLAAVAAAAVLLAQPPRKPLKVCGCGTSNEASRTQCIGCGKAI